MGQLVDRDNDGRVSLDCASGLKCASPFEGISTGLAGSQYEKGVGMSSDIVVRDLEGVANFDVQFTW